MKRRMILLAAVLAGCGFGPTELETPPAESLRSSGTTTSSSYTLRTTSQMSTKPSWKSSFAISSTYTVYLAFDLPRSVRGHHQLTLFVLMPDGGLYQRFDIAFATEGAGPSEQLAQKTTTGYRVWAELPVAGTMIDQYHIAGAWRADAHLDGAGAPTAAATFMLE